MKNIDEILNIEKEKDVENYNKIIEIVEEKKLAYIGRGGKRAGAGRPKKETVLNIQIRVSQEEKDFLKYARLHNLDYKSLMQG